MVLLLQYTLTFASVLILVALGGCFSEHSGVINLGLEGVMIMGALGGALAMRYLSTDTSTFLMIVVVLLAAAVLGTIYSSLLAVACINFKADQTIVGTALNMLGTAGATVIVKAINTAANPDDVSSTIQYAGAKKAFLVNIGSFEFSWFMLVTLLLLIAAYVVLYKTRFGLRLMACGEHPQAADSVGINVYKMRWAGVLISGMLGGLGGINTAANPDDVSSTIQYAGAKKAFLVNIGSFEFSWFMLVTLLLLIAAYVVLYKTRFGLRLMACGEHPQAADSVGINVYKMRWAGVLISGMLGGLGGIVFITAGVSEWRFEYGVAGFGFLALAVMIFGQWKPTRIALAALLFGLFRALSNVYAGFDFLKALNIPSGVYNMMPYIISLVVLAFTSKKSRAPKAEGIPYDKGQR